MAEGRGSSLLGSLCLISLGLHSTTSLPARTPGLPRWRLVPSASPSRPSRLGPHLSSSIRDPESPAPAHWLRRRRPRPPPARSRSCPAPSVTAMLAPCEWDVGGGVLGRRTPPPWHLHVWMTPEEFSHVLHATQSPRPPSVSPPGLLSQSVFLPQFHLSNIHWVGFRCVPTLSELRGCPVASSQKTEAHFPCCQETTAQHRA